MPWSRSTHSHLTWSLSLSVMGLAFSGYVCQLSGIFCLSFEITRGDPKTDVLKKRTSFWILIFLVNFPLYWANFEWQFVSAIDFRPKRTRKHGLMKQYGHWQETFKKFCFRKRPWRQNSNVISFRLPDLTLADKYACCSAKKMSAQYFFTCAISNTIAELAKSIFLGIWHALQYEIE